MAIRSPFLKYNEIDTTLTLEGCRSCCLPSHCQAMAIGACKGCIRCDVEKLCDKDCPNCAARCWQRQDLSKWIEDVGGLDLSTATCRLPFVDDLPTYVPQIGGKVWNVYHPAYVISIRRLINFKNMHWVFKNAGIKKAFNIPAGVRAILSFCTRDPLLEYIWSYQHTEWGDNKDFWQGLKDYGFDAALSADFSCYRNFPRMDHAICLKRNVLTAERLASIGLPVILDVMAHSDLDRERLCAWGQANGIQWYHMNFQTYKNVDYMNDIIVKRCDLILERIPSAKIVVTGVSDSARTQALMKRYGTKISFIHSVAYMNTIYYRKFYAQENAWKKEDRPLADLWAENILAMTPKLP